MIEIRDIRSPKHGIPPHASAMSQHAHAAHPLREMTLPAVLLRAKKRKNPIAWSACHTATLGRMIQIYHDGGCEGENWTVADPPTR